MLLIWFGLAGFFAFIAFRSFTTGSYLRGGFASFAVVLFVGSIWVSFQQPAVEVGPEHSPSSQASQAQPDPFADR